MDRLFTKGPVALARARRPSEPLDDVVPAMALRDRRRTLRDARPLARPYAAPARLAWEDRGSRPLGLEQTRGSQRRRRGPGDPATAQPRAPRPPTPSPAAGPHEASITPSGTLG